MLALSDMLQKSIFTLNVKVPEKSGTVEFSDTLLHLEQDIRSQLRVLVNYAEAATIYDEYLSSLTPAVYKQSVNTAKQELMNKFQSTYLCTICCFQAYRHRLSRATLSIREEISGKQAYFDYLMDQLQTQPLSFVNPNTLHMGCIPLAQIYAIIDNLPCVFDFYNQLDALCLDKTDSLFSDKLIALFEQLKLANFQFDIDDSVGVFTLTVNPQFTPVQGNLDTQGYARKSLLDINQKIFRICNFGQCLNGVIDKLNNYFPNYNRTTTNPKSMMRSIQMAERLIIASKVLYLIAGTIRCSLDNVLHVCLKLRSN